MIIDSHCHAGAGFGLTDPWHGGPLLARYLRRADAAGIERSVLLANFHDDYAVANRIVAGLVARASRRFFGLAFVHAQRDRGRVFAMVRTAVQDYGFVGIKVHRHDARITGEVCEAARAFDLPILYDVEGELRVLDWLARDFPDLAFIIPHLSSFAEDWRAQTAFLDRLAAYPNLHTDSSGVRFFDLLARVVERCGPHKLLFGSDGPWLHPGLELAKIRALRLPPAAQALVLGGNFLRLIKRPAAAPPVASGAFGRSRPGAARPAGDCRRPG